MVTYIANLFNSHGRILTKGYRFNIERELTDLDELKKALSKAIFARNLTEACNDVDICVEHGDTEQKAYMEVRNGYIVHGQDGYYEVYAEEEIRIAQAEVSNEVIKALDDKYNNGVAVEV